MSWLDDAGFVLLGHGKMPEYKATQEAIHPFEGMGVEQPRSNNPFIYAPRPTPQRTPTPGRIDSTHKQEIMRMLYESGRQDFTVVQVARHMNADPVQVMDVIDELVAEGQLFRTGQGVFSLPRQPPDDTVTRLQKQMDEVKSLVKSSQEMYQDNLFIINKKLDFWAKQIESGTNAKQKADSDPNKVVADYKGRILEIINSLKVIEMPGSDRELSELLVRYNDARREQLYYQERELANEIIPRMDAMISVYLHLVKTQSEFNKFLMDIYRENTINQYDSEEEEDLPERQMPAEQEYMVRPPGSSDNAPPPIPPIPPAQPPMPSRQPPRRRGQPPRPREEEEDENAEFVDEDEEGQAEEDFK